MVVVKLRDNVEVGKIYDIPSLANMPEPSIAIPFGDMDVVFLQ
jgi:hypothetical protein